MNAKHMAAHLLLPGTRRWSGNLFYLASNEKKTSEIHTKYCVNWWNGMGGLAFTYVRK